MTKTDRSRPKIFIVYESHERRLAEAVTNLLDCWGFKGFFCRQEIREHAATKEFREDLAAELKTAKLVVLLLSQRFRYSDYCQAEAGATVTMGKPQIQIVIPPVGVGDVALISPVLDGRELVEWKDPSIAVAGLRKKLMGHFKKTMPARPRATPRVRKAEIAAENELKEALAEVIQEYRIEPRQKASIWVWPSLEEISGAPQSIIEHIKRSITAGRTLVAVAGVSLKFSLDLISRALKELPKDVDSKRQIRGPLTVELVRMDDQSHILHSLRDTVDMGNILRKFHEEWAWITAGWREACTEAGIELELKEPVVIDYLPPQVGILIRTTSLSQSVKSVLYAGRCSFAHAGAGTNLLVGEREYAFYSAEHSYTKLPNRDLEAISVFDDYLRHYRSREHNGLTLVTDHNDWIQRLESCIATYHGVNELLVLSNTTTKFRSIVIRALRRGLLVRVYTRHPEAVLPHDRAKIESLHEDLARDIRISAEFTGRAEFHYFRHLPTFRAALIGDSVIGLQMYIDNQHGHSSKTYPGGAEASAPMPQLAASDLRLIVTRHAAHFAKVKGMIDNFLLCAGVDKEPYAFLGNETRQTTGAASG